MAPFTPKITALIQLLKADYFLIYEGSQVYLQVTGYFWANSKLPSKTNFLLIIFREINLS